MDFPQELLNKFRQHLLDQSVSTNTLKNYLSDLRVFLFFASSQYRPITSESVSLINQPEVIDKYETYLATINPPATVKRRLSSLRKFIDFCHQQGFLTSTPPITPTTPTPIPVEPIPTPLPAMQPLPHPLPPATPPLIPASDPTNYNLIKLMPEVSIYTPTKRSGSFPAWSIYLILLVCFITSFFITYFILD